MSIRSFVFCDICNPQGIRTIEFRRAPRKEDIRNGRRICDGRFWFEGNLSAAVQNGWITTEKGKHICPSCKANPDAI